jgi:hypothetical protein
LKPNLQIKKKKKKVKHLFSTCDLNFLLFITCGSIRITDST